MLLFNADLDEAAQNALRAVENIGDLDADGVQNPYQRFFDLRQMALSKMEPSSAFRIVALGLMRKLRMNIRGTVLLCEVEDAFSRYFRLLDGDMQRFATLHETFSSTAAEEQNKVFGGRPDAATAGAIAKLRDGMREIAVVLLACGEMQKRALDLKVSAQQSVAESDEATPALVSFTKFTEFVEDALGLSDQIRRKHEELQLRRMKTMAEVVSARVSSSAKAVASSPTKSGGDGTPTQMLSARSLLSAFKVSTRKQITNSEHLSPTKRASVESERGSAGLSLTETS